MFKITSTIENDPKSSEPPPKSVLMKEFEKLREETAGINSIFENKTVGNSTGLVSNSVLLEIRDMIGKMAEKQEKLEEKIERIDEKVEKLEENQRKSDEKAEKLEEFIGKVVEKQEKLEEKIEKLGEFIENSTESNRRAQIEIKEQLKVTNQKIEGVHKNLDLKIQQTMEKLENSKEKTVGNAKINEKTKNSPEYIDILLKHEYVDRVTPVKVKTTDKISILDGVRKMFGFPSPEYYIKDQNGQVKHVDRNSTFAHLNIKNGDVVSYGLIQ